MNPDPGLLTAKALLVANREYGKWADLGAPDTPLSECFASTATEAAEVGFEMGFRAGADAAHDEVERLQARNAELVRMAHRARNRTKETLRWRRWVSRT